MNRIRGDSLQFYYSNWCVEDGFPMEVFLLKHATSKHVILDNYYHADVGEIISFLNARLPAAYQIAYDIDDLIAGQKKMVKSHLKK